LRTGKEAKKLKPDKDIAMKVILTEYVYKHGVAGEVVKVADGFARNYLIPKKMAIPATKQNLEQLQTLRDRATQNRVEVTQRINDAAQRINGVELVFGMKAGSNNKLYGSITSQMIKDALLKKTGLDINRRRISERPIRELGRYEVAVRMGDVSPMLNIVVMREDEVNAYLSAQSAAQAAAQAAAQSAAEASVEAPAEEAPADTNA
jgi:large subunit ribosomal protein L9